MSGRFTSQINHMDGKISTSDVLRPDGTVLVLKDDTPGVILTVEMDLVHIPIGSKCAFKGCESTSNLKAYLCPIKDIVGCCFLCKEHRNTKRSVILGAGARVYL